MDLAFNGVGAELYVRLGVLATQASFVTSSRQFRRSPDRVVFSEYNCHVSLVCL